MLPCVKAQHLGLLRSTLLLLLFCQHVSYGEDYNFVASVLPSLTRVFMACKKTATTFLLFVRLLVVRVYFEKPIDWEFTTLELPKWRSKDLE